MNEAKDRLHNQERQYRDLVELSNGDVIDSKIKVEFEEKFSVEKAKWDKQNKNLVTRCDQYLRGKCRTVNLV